MKANWRNKRGSWAGDTSCLNIDPINSDAIETGPTARSFELPSTAYTSGGTKLESVYI